MRQRVGLARALAFDADIILMDEPFSSVDEQTRRKFQEELLELLRHKQKTVVFVTHSIEEAVYLSDQIVLLSPRPGTVSKIIHPDRARRKDPDEIRRDKNYLDVVDEIWQILSNTCKKWNDEVLSDAWKEIAEDDYLSRVQNPILQHSITDPVCHSSQRIGVRLCRP